MSIYKTKIMNNLIIKIADYNTKEIKEIRKAVFVIEQKVPENLEWDGLDSKAEHILAKKENNFVGTGRIFSDGHIGRIAVLKNYRGQGIGKMIVKKLVEIAKKNGLNEVWLSSQCSAVEFYKKLGFSDFGEIFKDAGIDHINMKKRI